MYVAAVDYDRYLVFFWCNPSFENCSPSAAVYTRDPIADAELNTFLEEFMMEKFCVDTTEWINIQRADVDGKQTALCKNKEQMKPLSS